MCEVVEEEEGGGLLNRTRTTDVESHRKKLQNYF